VTGHQMGYDETKKEHERYPILFLEDARVLKILSTQVWNFMQQAVWVDTLVKILCVDTLVNISRDIAYSKGSGHFKK